MYLDCKTVGIFLKIGVARWEALDVCGPHTPIDLLGLTPVSLSIFTITTDLSFDCLLSHGFLTHSPVEILLKNAF